MWTITIQGDGPHSGGTGDIADADEMLGRFMNELKANGHAVIGTFDPGEEEVVEPETVESVAEPAPPTPDLPPATEVPPS